MRSKPDNYTTQNPTRWSKCPLEAAYTEDFWCIWFEELEPSVSVGQCSYNAMRYIVNRVNIRVRELSNSHCSEDWLMFLYPSLDYVNTLFVFLLKFLTGSLVPIAKLEYFSDLLINCHRCYSAFYWTSWCSET